jgi:hypothetical protein
LPCRIGRDDDFRSLRNSGDEMKRSRRVILMLMGTAAVGSVSMGFRKPPNDCAPGRPSSPNFGEDGFFDNDCRVQYGGFGATPGRFSFPTGGG